MAKARPITGLDAQAPLATNARLIAKERLAELYQWDHSVDNPYNIRELHDLRIAAKRLRYTFEVFEEVLPAASEAIVNELTQIQDELGAVHDSDVMIALLRMCLVGQDSDMRDGNRHSSHGKKALVPAKMAAYLLDPSAAPDVEQRYGLEQYLQQQEHLRAQYYSAFRQHWYQLQARDFRREILDTLNE
ncbi:MAG TPA: CHAD domain-containing protein [Ktedonobacteraceae bacterium]|nr:CHAD domain-containing protein [Ktedonobacteraceae bacterium]